MNSERVQQLGDKIVQVLKTIYDPEIPVDIFELGLIYDVFVSENNDVNINDLNLAQLSGCRNFTG